MLIGYLVILLLLLLPLNSLSMNSQTTCHLSNLPFECHCPRTRHIPELSSNKTYVRCRQLTEITTHYPWSNISYDRLVFETFYDNLTLHRYVFSDIIVGTLRFTVPNLFLNDRSFANAYIGQLVIAHHDSYGKINFQFDSQIFYSAIITNLYFKSIDFHGTVSEQIFSHARIHTLIIQSSKFYGFTNKNLETTMSNTTTKLKYDHFLEYDYSSPRNLKPISHIPIDENSSRELEPITMRNITSPTSSLSIKIYTIISSINTTNLTDNYFPNNLDSSQLEELQLSHNHIKSLNAHVFRYFQQFQGRLILTNNQIEYIHPYAFTNLFLVKNLSLATNFIRDVSSIHFQNLNRLYELDLSFNRIEELNTNTFEYLENLHILYLNYNPLKFIHSEAFSNLTRLKQIHFQGVQFIHLIDQEYLQWIWSLASLHVIHLIKTDFDLTDVAFCILSRYNQTLFHLSRQGSCSCNIHYFNRNQDRSILQYDSNYVRLTPVCNDNDLETNSEQNQTRNELILQNLEDKCNYKFMYVDCDAMTTTTVMSMTSLVDETNTSDTDMTVYVTTEPPVSSSRPAAVDSTTEKPINNMKKLFTVLGTLLAITLGAVIIVFFWYRFKAMLKRKRKKRKFIEHDQHFNSPVTHSQRSSVPRYASVDMLGSVHSGYLFGGNKGQLEALIEPLPSAIYKNIDAPGNERIESFIDDDGLQQDPKAMTGS